MKNPIPWATLALAGGILAGAAADGGAAPPNVLFIAVDDLKPTLGCYGDRIARTPHIDRLAAGGAAFQRAYCQQAVCAPSRNSVLTGLRPDTLGIYDLGTFFRTKAPDAVTLPQAFMAGGYRTEAMGKIYHVGHGNRDDAASWSVPPWKTGGADYALPANREREAARRRDNNNRGPAFECADVPDTDYRDGAIALKAVKRMEALKGGAPFFLAVGFLKPHLPFNAPRKYWDLYDRSQFQLPARTTPPDGAPGYAATHWGELRRYTDVPPVGPLTKDQARELVHGYYACVSFVDAQVGILLDALDRLGLADNTVVVLWGDHGWHLGDHGQWCKHTNYEQATRAPLVVRAPGMAKTGTRPMGLVEFVDIYPTLAEWCGVATPTGLDGRSFAALLRDPEAPGKPFARHVYPRPIPDCGKGMGRAIRTDRYRLVEWTVDGRPDFCERELYDYEADPDETVNLAGRPEQADRVRELSALLRAHPPVADVAPGTSRRPQP